MAKQFNPVIPDYRPKSERTAEVKLPLQPCIVCQKMTQGYGTWHSGITCSRECEAVQESKPKLHGGYPCEKPS